MKQLIQKLTDYTRVNGGHETRHYLGLSQLHRDEEELVQDMINGSQEASDADVLKLALGYVVEEDIRKRLEGIGLAMPNTSFEIYADYDQRVKGHIDGMTNKGNQIYEIKSCVQAQLDFIRNNGDKLPKRHFNQVQAYMHHGRFKSCLMVYVARDTGEIWTKEVFYLPVVGASIEQKAKSVLKMYDDALLKNKY